MKACIVAQFFFLLLALVETCFGISSPIEPRMNYKHSIELQKSVADLWWTVDPNEREITFELHIKTTGWIALGISPAGGMKGADIAVGWIDRVGNVHFQDRHAFGMSPPVIDNTTSDWFHLYGREQNGWTSIQFKRLLDTCDYMDVPIKSGTNIIIFAYGLVDPDESGSGGDITYHDTRRGTRMIPLRSYADPPEEDKFTGLDSFEFRVSNYRVPSDESTYYCKVYKAPSHLLTKRHAVAHKVLIESTNRDLVHHMVVYECDPAATFDDANLPDDACDNVYSKVPMCMSNSATVWAIGGDDIEEYPEEAGYPVGGDFPVRYYVLELHYDNPKRSSHRIDSSGIRFYIGKDLRQHDLGFLSFGTGPNPVSLAIPPQVNRFIVDSYCSPKATEHFPESGITVLSAFPHTHLQGHSIWTKLIRNDTAVQYLFNAEAYNFNYQFENTLPTPIKLYPGDAFATRCVYNTMDKKDITLGGLRTKDEMCLHIFGYYPRMNNFYSCFTRNQMSAWQALLNISSPITSNNSLKQLLLDVQWTPELAIQWQEFYNNAARTVYFGSAGHFEEEYFARLPKYEDLKPSGCAQRRTWG